MSQAMLIKNGQVLIDGELKATELLIEEGMITDIGGHIDAPATVEVIDATGLVVAPGFIDVHVHLREPGFEYKETIATGTLAAASGGYTHICAMPNTNPVMDTPEQVRAFNARVAETGLVEVETYAAITKGLRSDELVDFAGLVEAGCFAFTNDGVGVQTAATMYEAMQACHEVNKPLVAHCEEDSLIYGGALHQGARAAELGVPGIPNICESVQIARDVLLAEAADCHYHVCHVSTKESVRIIRDAKRAGIRVTAEVTPHHLLMTENDIPDTDYVNYKMNPPLRSNADRDALIEGLLDGTIDFIATDHAPHSKEDKEVEITKSSFGIIGLEHAFGLLYTAFVATQLWSLEQLLSYLAEKPANVFGMESGIAVGKKANITLIDLSKATEIAAPYYSKSGNTPFAGLTIQGQIAKTIVQGKLIFDVTAGA